MNEDRAVPVVTGDETATVGAEARKSPPARTLPKWETDVRDRIRAGLKRFTKPLQDLVERDANEGDTRLLVTRFPV